MDKTQFIFDMTDERTLDFTNDERVRYADVTSGSERMTFLLRISAHANANIETPLLIVKKKYGTYPIRGVPDNFPEFVYRTGPKGWMDSKNIQSWSHEQRPIKSLPRQLLRAIFIDNFIGHELSEEIFEAAENILTTVSYLPSNTNDETQPAYPFVIKKVKAAWRKRWD